MPTGLRDTHAQRADAPSAIVAPLIAELSQAHRQIAEQAERIGLLEAELTLERQRVQDLEQRAAAVRIRAEEIRVRALQGVQRKHALQSPQPDRSVAAVTASVLSMHESDPATPTVPTVDTDQLHEGTGETSGDAPLVDPEWQLDEAWWRTTTKSQENSPSLPLVTAELTRAAGRRKRWWR